MPLVANSYRLLSWRNGFIPVNEKSFHCEIVWLHRYSIHFYFFFFPSLTVLVVGLHLVKGTPLSHYQSGAVSNLNGIYDQWLRAQPLYFLVLFVFCLVLFFLTKINCTVTVVLLFFDCFPPERGRESKLLREREKVRKRERPFEQYLCGKEQNYFMGQCLHGYCRTFSPPWNKVIKTSVRYWQQHRSASTK